MEKVKDRNSTSSDSESVHDISDYLYLIDKVHYDPEEKCEYKSNKSNRRRRIHRCLSDEKAYNLKLDNA